MTIFERASVALVTQTLLNVVGMGKDDQYRGVRRVKHIKKNNTLTFVVDRISWRDVDVRCSDNHYKVYDEGGMGKNNIKLKTQERPYTQIIVQDVYPTSIRGKADGYQFLAEMRDHKTVKVTDNERNVYSVFEVA